MRQVNVLHARSNQLDVALEFRGVRFSVRDVGIGHPPHAIAPDADGARRGRVATDVEVALAEALAQALAVLPAKSKEKE